MKKPPAIAVGSVLLAAGTISFLTLAGLRKSRAAVDVRDAAGAGVDVLFAEWNRSDSPGCSVGASRNAVPVLERGYGMANLELRVPITPASVFHVASVSKQFTAMSILLLSQRGKLPLGMMQTHVHDDPRMIVPSRASGYHRDAGGLHVAPHLDLGRLVGTTALHTTARDLLRWLDNFGDARVGDPALLAAMQTPTVLTGGNKSFYGFGLEIGEHRGLRTTSHGGGDPELGVTYTLVARDTGLVLQMPGRPDVQLKPFVPDKFYGTLVEVVTFSRDGRGVLTGFTVHTTGVRSLRFDRLHRLG